MKRIAGRAQNLINKYAPVNITCERHEERDPHPFGQEAFDFRVQYPWHREPLTRIMVEIAVDEKILKPIKNKPILHEYGERIKSKVPVYSLEEIVAEKLRSILQHTEKLKRKGWSRSRARDYYDLWSILGTYSEKMNFSDFPSFLDKKCAIKKVTYKGVQSFFQSDMLAQIEKTWDRWLGPLVANLPPYKKVIRELRPKIGKLLYYIPTDWTQDKIS